MTAHAWTDKFDTQNHWQECSGCGYKTGVAAHSLTKNVNETQHQVKCESCGYKTEWENHTGGTATCTALAVCDICGHTYGDLLPHDYRWVIDQEATTEATGLKHEECTACGDKRSEGTEIPKLPRHSSSVSTPDIQPILTADEAKSATDYSGGIYGLTFRASTGYGSFKGVKVNGKTIGAGNYIAEENGGTEIYLKAAYLQTLAPGKYTMTVMTESGEVTTEFTVGGVMTAPKTADAGALVYLAMALSSYTGTALVARKRRKEF